jgi:cell division protein FtsB
MESITVDPDLQRQIDEARKKLRDLKTEEVDLTKQIAYR